MARKPSVLDERIFLDGSVIETAGFNYAEVGQMRYFLQRLTATTCGKDMGGVAVR